GRVNPDLSVAWLLVRIGNSSKLLQDAGPRLGIKSFAITLLTDIDRGREVNENEATDRFNHRANIFARRIVGRDRSTNGDSPSFRDLRGDVADAANIDVAMFLRKSKLGAQMFPDQVAVEQSDWPATHFKELGHENVGDG